MRLAKDHTDVEWYDFLCTALCDDKMSAEVSLFQINWSDIQISAIVGTVSGITNGGNAKSDGVEWNFDYVPIAGLALGVNGAYTHPRLLDALQPPTAAAAGDLLPDIPEWSANLSADYEHVLFAGYRKFFGVAWRYSDAREAEFPIFGGPRQRMPSYSIANLRTGIQKDFWSVTLYVKNIGNTMALSAVTPLTLSGGRGPQTATVLTPRTVGMHRADQKCVGRFRRAGRSLATCAASRAHPEHSRNRTRADPGRAVESQLRR